MRSSVDLGGDVSLQLLLGLGRVNSLLVSPNFSKSDGTGPVPVGLLDTSGRGRRLPRCLGGDCRRLSAVT